MEKKLFLMGALLVGAVLAQEEGADVLYAHEKWGAALAAYEKEEAPTPGVLVRMGDCAVKSKNYATGLRHWHKAARGLYFLSYYDIARRIFALEAEAGVHAATPTPAWYIATSCASVPPLLWQVCLLLLLLWGGLRARVWWRAKRRGLFLSLLCGILFFTGFAWWSMQYRTRVSAIVMQHVTVRTGPDERFSERGKISPPAPVSVADQAALPGASLWFKISAGDCVGWVPQSSLLSV